MTPSLPIAPKPRSHPRRRRRLTQGFVEAEQDLYGPSLCGRLPVEFRGIRGALAPIAGLARCGGIPRNDGGRVDSRHRSPAAIGMLGEPVAALAGPLDQARLLQIAKPIVDPGFPAPGRGHELGDGEAGRAGVGQHGQQPGDLWVAVASLGRCPAARAGRRRVWVVAARGPGRRLAARAGVGGGVGGCLGGDRVQPGGSVGVVAGELAESLRDFIRTALRSDACQAANLNHWAYWIGEVPETHSSDDFMAGDLGPWSGAALLRRLAANLVASEPLVDLYAHSVWALLERRGRLLEADPRLARSLTEGVEALLAEGDLSVQSRTELEQVHDGVRLLEKS
jgi:hypothetical protein